MPLVIERICLGEREREREKSAASAVWLQSSMREGEEGLVQHSSSKLRDCGGGQKGTCWPRTQVSFIHNRKHTHIRTQDEQQPFNSTRLAFATFYDFWFALSTFGVNYYFLLFVANKPLVLRWKAFFQDMAYPKPAFIWHNNSDMVLTEFRIVTDAGQSC